MCLPRNPTGGCPPHFRQSCRPCGVREEAPTHQGSIPWGRDAADSTLARLNISRFTLASSLGDLEISSRTRPGSTALAAARGPSPSLPGDDLGYPLGDVPHGTDVYKVLQFNGDAELAFRTIHDDREAAGSDGEVPSDIHVGLDLVPIESRGIHDDSNNPLHEILAFRRLAGGRGGLSRHGRG